MNCLTFDVNTLNKASGQYKGYNFNSFANFNGKALGANENGLFELAGDTDNGELIKAEFQPIVTDFGSHNAKRMRKISMELCCSGVMEVELSADNADPNVAEIETKKYHRQTVHKTVGRRGAGRKGTFWGIKIKNVAGCDFSIYSIKLLVAKLHSGHS